MHGRERPVALSLRRPGGGAAPPGGTGSGWPTWLALAALGILALADWVRRATEELAGHVGSAVGGLVNVTFGNLAELVIALTVLTHGHADVVKAQIERAMRIILETVRENRDMLREPACDALVGPKGVRRAACG